MTQILEAALQGVQSWFGSVIGCYQTFKQIVDKSGNQCMGTKEKIGFLGTETIAVVPSLDCIRSWWR